MGEMRERTWMSVGEEFVERIGRERVEAAVGDLDWQTVPEDGSLDLPFSQGSAIKSAIHEFRMPGVCAVALSGFDCPDDDEGDGWYPGFYGVEAEYVNGRARLYLLDTGVELCPLLSDFWPVETGDRVAA